MNDAPATKKPVYKKWWFWVGALVVIGALSNGKNGDGSSANSEDSGPAIAISAVELAAAYDGNEAAGDAQFKGKKLAVTGTVDSVTKDMSDDTIIELVGTKPMFGVRAEIDPSQEQKAITLTKGMSVTVTCTGAGEIVSSPRLDDCIIN